MRIGAAFPTTEIGTDPDTIRHFATAVEDMGFDHLTAIDHVLQAGRSEDTGWRSYYTRGNMFHEPFVLFGFLAAATRSIELATAILILPQRPAVLVAKQAAELDLLSAGRLRLGVGIGWNALEFDALGQNFRNRGRRIEEQVEVMRLLWTQDLVTFEGEWHRISDAGINPLPVQQPIPLWFGAFEEPAIRRAGRLGDGWYLNPRLVPGDEVRHAIGVFHTAAAEAGRATDGLGIDATLHVGSRTPADCGDLFKQWCDLGVSHVTIRTMYSDLDSPSEHLRVLEAVHAACVAP